jgi:hypothetical protein
MTREASVLSTVVAWRFCRPGNRGSSMIVGSRST